MHRSPRTTIVLELGIMKSGQFMCLGNLRHLKNRFSTGYAIQIKAASEESVARLTNELAVELPGIEILGKLPRRDH